jgi:ERF superfamily
MSAAAATIYQVFADVKREVGPVGKDSTNQQQNYSYRGIDAVVNAAAAALDRHGVVTIPMLETKEYATVEVGRNRSQMAHVQVTVTYRFAGPAGDWFDARVPGEAMDSGDKATPKAMSVAYRIALLQTLNLPTCDPDPDSVTYERSSRADPVEEWEEEAEIDAEAQVLAERALACQTLTGLDDVADDARAARKMNSRVKDPASGASGLLAKLVDWKRRELVKNLNRAGDTPVASPALAQPVPPGKE